MRDDLLYESLYPATINVKCCRCGKELKLFNIDGSLFSKLWVCSDCEDKQKDDKNK